MKWFYYLLDKTLLRDRLPENWVDILGTYLSEVPRNLGVAIIASSIVLLYVQSSLNKFHLALLFLIGFSFIIFSTGFDIKMMTELEYKEIKKIHKEFTNLSKQQKRKKK